MMCRYCDSKPGYSYSGYPRYCDDLCADLHRRSKGDPPKTDGLRFKHVRSWGSDPDTDFNNTSPVENLEDMLESLGIARQGP